jgi:hypothetical protein
VEHFMTRAFSATFVRAACVAALASALLGTVAILPRATASPAPSLGDRVSVSLVQSSTAVPLGGTLGFTGEVRFPASASSVQARLQIRKSGRLVFQRTQYLDSAEKGLESFSYSRDLEGLGLDAGAYPVTFSLRAYVDGSLVETEVTQPVRIYDTKKPAVPAVLLAKVHARPLIDTHGDFSVDPASAEATRTRDQVDRVALLALADPAARLTLAAPPVVFQEWRRIATSGYRLASGTVVPQSDPIAATYADALLHVQQAVATGRLELLSMGYADPNLADLGGNRLSFDAANQYDAGYSATFASIAATPSPGTAPAGGSVPKGIQPILIARHIRYTFAEGESLKTGKRPGVPSGAYRCAESTLTALVIDARSSRGLESSDASEALADTFARHGAASPQPVVLRIDLDSTTSDATSTVGLALAALESAPWVRLELGGEVQPPKGAKQVTAVPQPTRNAPAGYWAAVRSATHRAAGMITVLSASDQDAGRTQVLALLSESAAWSEPSAKWPLAKTGLGFAQAATRLANSIFNGIKVSATSVTLAGQSGNIPVTISNGSSKTLSAVVHVKTSNGLRVIGGRSIPTRLPPRDTFVQIPIDMQSALYGKVTVQVLAGDVVIARETVPVRRSYLDRLALIGMVVLVLGGMLVWIVVRVRRSPDTDEPLDDGDPEGEPPSTIHDSESPERYTDSARTTSRNRDS